MKFKVFIGVDVSKNWLDFAVMSSGKIVLVQRHDNNAKGIADFVRSLKKLLKGSGTQDWLFCMEHTGIYCNPLLRSLAQSDIALWLESAAEIKAFHGLARGKNDALDACRIAEYACMKCGKAKIWRAPREQVLQLRSLLKIRSRLLSSQKALQTPCKEDLAFGDKAIAKAHAALVKPAIDKLKSQIKETEEAIGVLLRSDRDLHRLFSLVKSVMGVGEIVAANILVVTNEFKSIDDPKKLACHSGVAPFAYDSGKSVRGRAKVSHRADKNMKSLLHLSAMSAIAAKGELKEYYLRKVGQGKNKMSVINAVRNKIIHRVFACVRDGRKYEKIYAHSLA